MEKIRKGDQVTVIAGKDKGRSGTVLRVQSDDRIVVEGVNIVRKTQKPNPQLGTTGGIIDKEMPIHKSNVMLFNSATGKGDRVGIKTLEDGKKVRFFRSNNEVVDV